MLGAVRGVPLIQCVIWIMLIKGLQACNVFVGEDFRLKLGDLGVARYVSRFALATKAA